MRTESHLPFQLQSRRRFRRPTAVAAAFTITTLGLPFAAMLPPALAATACPTGTTGVPFTWQGATSGNLATWNGGNDGYSQSYTVGTGATQVTMTMKMIDPLNRNADANHRFMTAPYAGLNTFGGLAGITTKSNGAYGAGWLTFGIGTLNSGEGATLNMSFDRPVVIKDLVVGDIDFAGYKGAAGGITNDPEFSYQDSVELRTQRGGNDIPYTVTPLAAGKVTTVGQTTRANYVAGVLGDLNPADPLGSVAITTAAPVNSVTLNYTNGPADAAAELGKPETRKSYVPAGTSGMSDGQAVRVSGFMICVGTGSIGDAVFNDNNGDGIQTPNETGIPGVKVYAKDPAGNIMATAITDATGKYTFPQLPPFTYTVSVDPTTLPASVNPVPTADPDPIKDGSTTVPVTGTPVTNIDFGYQPTRIAGFVYQDPNDDGIMAAGETPIKSTTLQLLNASGIVVATTATAADGSYEFLVAPGTYTIREVQPVGYVDGKDTAGTNGAAVTANDQITVTVAQGQQSVSNNFGEKQVSGISGKVYLDANNDGTIGVAEKSLAGITIELLDTTGAVVATTSSLADGTYTFQGLNPGVYTVHEIQPAVYLDGIDTPGTGTGTSATTTVNDKIAVTLGSGVQSTANNFGERPGAISGVVFNDATNAGVLDGTDPKIAGVSVQLLNSTGAVIATTTTDVAGAYSFSDLPAGEYSVRETQPIAFTDSVELPGAGNSTPSNDLISVTLTAGQVSAQNNFAEVVGAISGTVWVDANNDGLIGGAETKINNVTVRLRNAAGVIVATTTTSATGTYTFSGLAVGDYTVEETQPGTFSDGKDRAGTSATILANDKITVSLTAATPVSTGNNFGERAIGNSSIAGTVFLDNNRTGVQATDGSEPGIAGVTLNLVDSNGDIVATTTTNVNGGYSFTALPAGTYSVVEVQPTGYLDGVDQVGSGADSPFADTNAGIVVGSNSVISEVNFGEVDPAPSPAKLSGKTYVDNDNNGSFSAGDTPLAGVTIMVYNNATGAYVSSDVTDASGNYSITGLPAGTFKVVETQPALYGDRSETPGTGTTSSTVNDQILVTLASNGNSTGNNFGELPGVISGAVYFDADNSGTNNAGDTPVSGVSISLLNEIGTVVATTTTDGTGAYSFTGLPAGKYSVVETQPSAYGDGAENPGTGTTSSPMNDRINVTLAAGGSSTANSFGETLSAIKGSVYEDTTLNGKLTAGEAAIVGVTVNLLNAAGTQIATTTTNGTGAYEFLDLLPGKYTVVEVQPVGYADRPETAGNLAAVPASTNDRIAVDLTNGGVSVGNNFGEITLVPGTISGTVYVDANTNGSLTAAEPKISGVTVELLDATNTVIATVVTGPNGTYSFPNLAPGNYKVREVQPTTWIDAAETAGTGTAAVASSTTNDVIAITLANGETSSGNNFGEVGATLSGHVFAETDNNGLLAAGEPLLAGVVINLLDSTGAQIASTTTDADGFYEFANLKAGVYSVVEVQPSTHRDGKEHPGTGTTSTPSNDKITVTLAAGATSSDNDFAEVPAALAPVRIAGSVWLDKNNDGIVTPGELPLGGQIITLLDRDGVLVTTTTTSGTGTYEFVDLPAGTYSVVETAPAGYADGRDSVGTLGSMATANDKFTVTLTAGQESVSNNFGELPARIAGTVYNDANNDGLIGSTEAKIAGTTVNLLNSAGTIVATTTTAADGTYAFENLVAGNYKVVEVQPAAWSDGKDTVGTGVSYLAANDAFNVTAPAGGASVNNNFGELAPPVGVGSISGFVYLDVDTNGAKTAGDTPITTTVNLVDDNGVVVATTTTDGTGAYSFANIPAGNYTVVETQPAGYLDATETAGNNATIPVATNDRIAVTVTPGSSSTNNNFGELAPSPIPASISGMVFADLDKAGDLDASDPGIGGVTVILLNAVGTEVSRTITASNGAYTFTGLPADTYTIVEQQPPTHGDGADLPGTNGATSTVNDRIAVTVAAGETSTSNNFGEVLGTISGQVFVDSNNTAGRQVGEPAISGVTINLIDATGTVVATTTTGADGTYTFNDVVAGTYRVVEVQPSSHADGTDYPGTGTTVTAGLNDIMTVVLTAGGASTGNDFGERVIVPVGAISGYVYADVNNDGVKDSGEAPIGSVSLRLLDSTGAVVANTTSGPDGFYSFGNIVAGDYTIVEVQPSGYTDGLETPGTGTTDTTINERINVSLPSGASSTGNNFGEIPPTAPTGSISGFAYVDATNDGARTGDAPIAAVTVTLYNELGAVVGTTTTGADGSYSFSAVPAGNYRIVESQPGGFLDGKDTPGTGGTSSTANDTLLVTLASGASSFENNFGERPPAALPATISGSVYTEIDNTPGKGITDTPIAGVTVHLLDSSGTEVATTMTAPDGSYSFTGLPAGSYTVVEDQPAGVPDAAEFPGSGTTSSTVNDRIAVTVAEGQTSTGNNFSEAPPLVGTSTVGGSVFVDTNNDGVKDPTETGIAGVKVELVDGSGNVVGTTYTNANGGYTFANVPAGTYTIKETQPANWPDGIDMPGSGGTLAGNDQISVVVPAGAVLLNHNFGEVGARITGTVYADANNDGINNGPAGGEAPIANVTLVLRDASGATVATTTTAPDGTYSFGPVPTGSYTVVEYQPVTFDDGKETPGTGATSTVNDQIVVTVTAGAVSANNNFGELVQSPPSLISGTVFRDRAKDGVLSNGDPGIEGVTVSLLDASGAVVATFITGPSGNYAFPDLAPGTYTVVETQPTDYDDGGETSGLGATSAVNDRFTVVLGAGATSAGNNFGELPKPGTIGGRVYVDLNNNALMDTSPEVELPLAGVAVTLQTLAGVVVATTTTDAMGNYQFLNVAPGQYKIVETQPTNALDGKETPGVNNLTLANDQIGVTLGDGGISIDNDFGELPSAPLLTPGRITGSVVVDTDGNGHPTVGETPIAGVTIQLLNAAGTVIGTTTTAADGTYAFNSVLPGAYTVREVQPPLYGDGADGPGANATVLANDQFTVTVAPGRIASGNDFGESLRTISGSVLLDSNRDGAPDSPIVGVTLELLNASGTVVATTATASDGTYSFTDLVGGVYTVRETQPSAHDDGAEAPGPDATSTTNDEIVVNLTGAVISPNQNFVEQIKLGKIAGAVVVDANNNGHADSGEAPIANVTIELVNAAGAVVATVTTGVDGTYLFDKVLPGTYTVREVQPVAYGDGTDGPGNAATLLANDQFSVVVTPASSSTANDFGEKLGSINGVVQLDTNRDGTPDAPIAGVTVQLVDATGAVVATAITGANGGYSFPALLGGTYKIREVQPTQYDDGAEVPGTDASTTANDEITVVLVGGVNSAAQNFVENIKYGKISGTVVEDANGNGKADAGETSIGGVTIELVNAAGVVVKTTTTAADGTYTFADILPVTWTVREVQPAPFVDGADSPGNLATVAGNDQFTVALQPDSHSAGNDFGEKLGSISGVVQLDIDRDGTPDAPIAGVTLQLVGPDGSIVATVVTGADGTYTFPNLSGGTYKIREVQPAQYDDGAEVPGQYGTSSVNDEITVALPRGINSAAQNFVDNIKYGKISGTVVEDANGNGKADAGETPIAGVTIELVNAAGVVVKTTTTGPDGTYTFKDILPIIWTVREVQPGAFRDGTDSPGNMTTVAGNDQFTIDLQPDGHSTGNDFGEKLGSISGSVLLDNDRDGTTDGPLAGVKLELVDASGKVVATATTDSAGNYFFPGLLGGTYKIREVQPANYDDSSEFPGKGGKTTANDEITVTLPNGSHLLNHVFVDQAKLSQLVFPQVTITSSTSLVDSPVAPPRTAEFSPVNNEVKPANTPNAPSPQEPPVATKPTTSKPGANDIARVGGRVWIDRNDDSTSNEKEKGAAAITLRIFDSSGKVVAIVETKPDGSWSADLPVGTYELETVLPEGYRATTSPRVRFSVVLGESIVATPVGIIPDANALAFTGSSSMDTTTEALAIIGTGLALTAISRRRRVKTAMRSLFRNER